MIKNLSNVKFYGSYDRSELPEIFSKNDLLVVPSIWWENSPMVIQESFMANVPVLCSNIGGMKEKVVEGKNGWYFEVGDSGNLINKINYLLNNESVLKRINKKFFLVKDVDFNIRELIDIYSTLV
jgi:glycosyltransferase involved in cell wall biosynthesis